MHCPPNPPSAPKVGITEKARAKVAAIMSHVLADELSLSATTRDFYATVTGPNFHSLHKLFDDQYRQLESWLGRLAARTRALGVTAKPDLPPSHSSSPVGIPPRKMIGDLLALHEQIAGRLREDVRACAERLGDRTTATELARLIEFHETTAWMLRMVLNGSEETSR